MAMTSANAARQAVSTRPSWTDLAGMFWLCFASLLFELTCNRVMFVQHYGHLGYVVIGTALFGFALAGVLYACSARVRAIRGDALVPACALLAALFMGVAYLVISFVPLFMGWRTWSSRLYRWISPSSSAPSSPRWRTWRAGTWP